jgi:predicted thioesterase
MDAIGEGRHQRFVVAWDKFNARLDDKRARMAMARQAVDG